MSKRTFAVTTLAAALLAAPLGVAQAQNYNVYGSNAYQEVLRSQAAVNHATASAIERESIARARHLHSHSDLVDHRVRVMHRTEDTEVFGRNVSNVAGGVESIGRAAVVVGAGAAALRWGFR